MCVWGTTLDVRVLIPADLAAERTPTWKMKPIDACLAPLVRALSEGGVTMRSSCCGHGRGPGEILLDDGRRLTVATTKEGARDDAE